MPNTFLHIKIGFRGSVFDRPERTALVACLDAAWLAVGMWRLTPTKLGFN